MGKVQTTPDPEQRLEERHRETSADGFFARGTPRPSQLARHAGQPGGPGAPPAMLDAAGLLKFRIAWQHHGCRPRRGRGSVPMGLKETIQPDARSHLGVVNQLRVGTRTGISLFRGARRPNILGQRDQFFEHLRAP
jgi:hypothetical protein